jgi:fido (protein-threonine AMPylation protein)
MHQEVARTHQSFGRVALVVWPVMPDDDQDNLFPGFAAFRDDESSRFYCSLLPAFGTPQKTAAEITVRLSRVVFNVTRNAARRPLQMGVEDLLRWHTGIFKTTFPHEAGQLRSAQTQFGVRWREGAVLKARLILGSDPVRVRAELHAAFARYNTELERCAPGERSARAAVTAAGRLYANILLIHPFDDGNLRAALPALQAALVSLGTATVHFEAAVAEHDEALGWALRPDAENRTIEPFAELLLTRMQDIGRGGS